MKTKGVLMGKLDFKGLRLLTAIFLILLTMSIKRCFSFWTLRNYLRMTISDIRVKGRYLPMQYIKHYKQ